MTMISNECEHLSYYTSVQGTFLYRTLHTAYISCLEGSNERTAREVFCYSCNSRSSRLHACLFCAHIGCYDGLHIQDHAIQEDHYLAVDLIHGNIFCCICDDYVYDEEFEYISNEFFQEVSRKQGKELYIPWKPDLEDLKAIQEHGGVIKVIEKSPFGLRGLYNFGQTCYMNCIIQVLTHTTLFRNYFLSDKHGTCAKKHTDCVACAMFYIIQEFYSGNTVPYSPHMLLFTIWKDASAIASAEQHDAQEFLNCFLNSLHEQCERKVLNIVHCSCPVHQIFSGFVRSDVECLSCRHSNTTYAKFLDIQLDLGEDDGNMCTLEDCIKRYTEYQDLPESICGYCQGDTRTKHVTLYKLPPVICFHLQRLSGITLKNSKYIKFDECVDMAEFTSNMLCVDEPLEPNEDMTSRTSNARYSLFAVVEHIGTYRGGHYIAYIKLHRDDWYECDDEKIKKISVDQVLLVECYLLFYKQQVLQYGDNPDLK